MLRVVAAALFSIASACASPDLATAPSAPPIHANPVLDENFPDPAVLRATDGFYYAYATQGHAAGRMLNIQVARSPDLVSWERLGDALPVKPAWASRTQDFWAPDVSWRDGRYYLYYSAKPDAALADETRGLCLAVATAEHPQGPFTDSGRPLLCGKGFVNIDPHAFDDPATGRRLLYWGSGFEPIKVRELRPDRLGFAPGSAVTELVPVIADESPANYQRLVEAPWIVHREGWYYLFYSGDNCCGPKAHYAVMIARSRNATGPFETRAEATGSANSVMLERQGRWLAPGHNSVITDTAGDHWLLYHAIDTRRPRDKPEDEVNSRRVLLLDKLVWRNGWPQIVDRDVAAARAVLPGFDETPPRRADPVRADLVGQLAR